MKERPMMDRRRFLGLGTAAAIGLAAPHAAAVPVPHIRRTVTLGATGLRVSDVSFGSSSSSDPELVRYALDRGVTFFDSAESYEGGGSEEAIGTGLKGVRDKVVVSSKTKAWASHTRTDMMEALEGSLKRLDTDYLDIYFNHAVNHVDRMRNTEWWEFTERAKAHGKIRFRGMSGHGSRLVECLDYAIDKELVDVILCAHNFAQDPDFYARLRNVFHFVDLQPDLPRVLEKAKSKGIGVVAMKTLMGGRINDLRAFERPGGTFAQAALAWVLSSGRVDAALISMTGRAVIDEYVGASGRAAIDDNGASGRAAIDNGASGRAAVDDDDMDLLFRYAARQGTRYCRPGCNACAESCPESVDIAEVLRTRMYAVDYGDGRLARADYAKLGSGATACLTCEHRSCKGACPFGLAIPTLTRDAARRLA